VLLARGAASAADNDLPRIEAEVQHAESMGGFERRRNLTRHGTNAGGLEATLILKQLRQAPAFNGSGHHERTSVGLARSFHDGEMGVADLADELAHFPELASDYGAVRRASIQHPEQPRLLPVNGLGAVDGCGGVLFDGLHQDVLVRNHHSGPPVDDVDVLQCARSHARARLPKPLP
jgi:hypothetical protein